MSKRSEPSLAPLPQQPSDVAWPTQEWPEAALPSGADAGRIEAVCEELFEEPKSDATGETRALIVVHRGRLVVERYSSEYDRDSTHVSWSMAKSISHALVGILVGRGRLDIEQTGSVPAWNEPGDPRGAITLDHMLRMVDGLDFVEDYVDSDVSSVIEMLFGAGKKDVAGYAESCPPLHPPGSFWNYSSGTSNIVSGVTSRALGGGVDEMEGFMREALFDRIGMRSAKPRFDAAGHFIASSFVFATARDFARFGLLYLRDGCWEGNRVLPEGWVDYARTPSEVSKGEYGAHWWIARDGSAIFHASGYRGQFIAIDPERDMLVVRLGDSTQDQRGPLYLQLRELFRSIPLLGD